MQVKLENMEKNVAQLEIEVDAEIFEKGLQKAFRKNAKKFSIPGFRKGKAPRFMVEKFYGEQVLYEDAINEVCPEAYDQAVMEKELQPVDSPEIDIVQIGKGQALIFTAKVTVKPDVELGQYKGIEIEKTPVLVTDDEVEKEVERVRDANSRLINIEDRPAADGDTVIIDFDGTIDGEPFDGGKTEGYSLELGSKSFIDGFEEQIIGMSRGEEKDISVTFPEDYGKSELSGKPAVFKVALHEIKLKELPELDDEFAKEVSEFDTLEEYKSDLRQKLLSNAEHKSKHETEDRIVEKVVANASVDIPPVMIEKRADASINDFSMSLAYQGMELEQYLRAIKMDMSDFRKGFISRAEQEVKTQMILEKIGVVEEIAVSDDEVDEEIKKMAEDYKQSEEEFRKQIKEDNIKYIRNNLVMKKTIDFLVENAKLL